MTRSTVGVASAAQQTPSRRQAPPRQRRPPQPSAAAANAAAAAKDLQRRAVDRANQEKSRRAQRQGQPAPAPSAGPPGPGPRDAQRKRQRAGEGTSGSGGSPDKRRRAAQARQGGRQVPPPYGAPHHPGAPHPGFVHRPPPPGAYEQGGGEGTRGRGAAQGQPHQAPPPPHYYAAHQGYPPHGHNPYGHPAAAAYHGQPVGHPPYGYHPAAPQPQGAVVPPGYYGQPPPHPGLAQFSLGNPHPQHQHPQAIHPTQQGQAEEGKRHSEENEGGANDGRGHPKGRHAPSSEGQYGGHPPYVGQPQGYQAQGHPVQHPVQQQPNVAVMGSHTPIHFPRVELTDSEAGRGGNGGGGGGGIADAPPGAAPESAGGGRRWVGGDLRSVFRSSSSSGGDSGGDGDGKVGRKESEEDAGAELLLNLSKSFEARSPVKPGDPPAAGAGERILQPLLGLGDDSGESPGGSLQLGLRGSFEPSPGVRIDMSSSFQLFNESFDVNRSFDMNLENILGPNPSFGFGPMKSLSFALDCASNVGEGAPAGIQGAGTAGGPGGGNVVLTNASRVGRLPGGEKGDDGDAGEKEPPSPAKPSKGKDEARTTRKVQLREPADEVASAPRAGRVSPRRRQQPPPPPPPQVAVSPRPPVIPPHFDVVARHAGLLRGFTFLLPSAHALLFVVPQARRDRASAGRPPPTVEDGEAARRRVNSGLCAMGGVALSRPSVRAVEGVGSLQWLAGWKAQRVASYRSDVERGGFDIVDDSRVSWDCGEGVPVKGAVGTGEGAGPADAETRDGMCTVYPALNAHGAAEPGVITESLTASVGGAGGKRRGRGKKKGAKGGGGVPDLPRFLPPVVSSASTKTPAAKAAGELPEVTPDPAADATPSAPGVVSTAAEAAPRPALSANHGGGAALSAALSPRRLSGDIPSGAGNGKDGGPEAPSPFVEPLRLDDSSYLAVRGPGGGGGGGGGSAAASTRRSNPYAYRALPLPYSQRKNISNAMFAMSKTLPGLTDECAHVLGEARRRDVWDFAVAELMVQVVLLTRCGADDDRLDGLRSWLLGVGVSC